jgi:hypothetical protein
VPQYSFAITPQHSREVVTVIEVLLQLLKYRIEEASSYASQNRSLSMGYKTKILSSAISSRFALSFRPCCFNHIPTGFSL